MTVFPTTVTLPTNTSPTTIASTCAYCGVGCGIRVESSPETRQLTLRGDEQHPANQGRLCSKGSALSETTPLQGRLLAPKIHGRESDWNEALTLVAQRFNDIRQTHGPEAIAFYVSGQLLTEDYYVANKLMKGFIGSGNIDTNSRLCMSSSVAGYKRAFGSDTVPVCYEDIDLADLIVLVGSNTAWCHPIVFQRIKRAKEANPRLRVVVIDPRRTATCDIADLHLALAHGSDVAIFNGLLTWLAEHQQLDTDYINSHTRDFDETLAATRTSLAEVAKLGDLDTESLQTFYRWYAETSRVLTLFSQGVNQSSSGTDKVNAIINCHLATGRIGKPGAGPFSLTGQPNAMGGREVGGLANQLAAHMDFTPDNVDRVGRFWNSPAMAKAPGLKAVDLFDAIYDGQVKAVWIMGTNPVVSMPNADRVASALSRCEFVVVSDCIEKTDTNSYAHVLLPAQGWSEKDGTVTNSERRISRQRQLLPSAGMARADWDIIADVGRRMGYENTFSYHCVADVFREHAALSGFENGSSQQLRDFNISGLANISNNDYDALEPVQWPVTADSHRGTSRMFVDGQFFTVDRKACFVATRYQPPTNACTAEFPLVLNTGRIRDQWHTMTRTALAAKLNQHLPEPFAEIHPDTAARFGLNGKSGNDGQGLVHVKTAYGVALVRAKITDQVRRDEIFMPMHWNRQFASLARAGALTNPVVDRWSGQPELKHTPASITAWQPQWFGKVLVAAGAHEIDIPGFEYAAKTPQQHSVLFTLASKKARPDLHDFAPFWQPASALIADDVQTFHDDATDTLRWAGFRDGRLLFVVMLAREEPNIDMQWLDQLFGKPQIDAGERRGVLSGKSPAGVEDCGRIVCACFSVGEKTLRKAIVTQKLTTPEQIGACLKAGTNCGSCIPELKSLLASS